MHIFKLVSTEKLLPWNADTGRPRYRQTESSWGDWQKVRGHRGLLGHAAAAAAGSQAAPSGRVEGREPLFSEHALGLASRLLACRLHSLAESSRRATLALNSQRRQAVASEPAANESLA